MKAASFRRFALSWAALCILVGQGRAGDLIGQLGGPTTAVAVEGNRAYVGVGLRLAFLDISNPTAPRELGVTIPFPHFVEGVAVAGTRVYVAAGGAGLRIVYVSDSSQPVEVGYVDTRDYAEAVAVGGNIVSVADGPYGLRLFDVTDPRKPLEVGAVFGTSYALDAAT